MLYTIPDGATLHWKSWEDESGRVVFHVESGQTHQLDELAAQVVEQLQDGPLLPQQICERVADEFALEQDLDRIGEYLTQLLPQLTELGLIEELQSCS